MITFQHQTDVRRIIHGEFDRPKAAKILLTACREMETAADAAEYKALIWRAERFLLFGDADTEEE